MLGDKMRLGKFKKIDITPSIFSYYIMTLEGNYKKMFFKSIKKTQKHVEAKQYATKQLMDTEEIKDEIKNTLKQIKVET